MRHNCISVLRFLATVSVFLGMGAALFLPMPKKVSAGGAYTVEWEDGTRTAECYADVSRMLKDCTSDGLFFEREGLGGRMEVSGEYTARYRLLSESSLAELLSAKYSALSSAEELALYRKFAKAGYYSEEFFAYDGNGFFRTERNRFSEVVLMTGDISGDVLKKSGAEKLTVRAEARVSGGALFGTRVKEFGAFAPYFTSEDALFSDALGGTRLVAALPLVEELNISEEIRFCDGGALLPCARLKTLTLPFAGSSVNPVGSDYDGRLCYMFGERVPESLVRVKITGGALKTFAFEGCSRLAEIDLCGMDADVISKDAFVGCYGLKKLHTSLKNPNLDGNFKVSQLSCGCYLYEREES